MQMKHSFTSKGLEVESQIEQIILYDEVKFNYFSLEELNEKIINRSKIIEDYNKQKFEERIYRNIKPELDNELWKMCQEKPKLYISNLGRVKIGNIVWKQKDATNKIGYLILEDFNKIPNDYKEYIKQFNYVYQLVARIWLGRHIEDGCVWDVHHISGAGYDNRPENLIWMKRCIHKRINHKNNS